MLFWQCLLNVLHCIFLMYALTCISLMCVFGQDVMMPDVDGLELLRQVRADESLATMPVVSKPALFT